MVMLIFFQSILRGIFFMLQSIFSSIFEQVLHLISYISNGSSFPKPLSAEDEAKYLDAYQNGDMAARDKLVEHNLRLVAHIAKKYSSSVRCSEDLISVSSIKMDYSRIFILDT